MTSFLDRELIDKSGGPDACWEWQGYRDKNGYVAIKHNKIQDRAHRFAYEDAIGPIPEGRNWCVCHHCDNPPCCNPRHLFLGTRKDNTQDMIKKGRNNPPRGAGHAGSKLSESDVLEIVAMSMDGYPHRETAKRFGVAQPVISYICTGKSWTHLADQHYRHLLPIVTGNVNGRTFGTRPKPWRTPASD